MINMVVDSAVEIKHSTAEMRIEGSKVEGKCQEVARE
jgi:hypothetical protein